MPYLTCTPPGLLHDTDHEHASPCWYAGTIAVGNNTDVGVASNTPNGALGCVTSPTATQLAGVTPATVAMKPRAVPAVSVVSCISADEPRT